MSQYPGQCWSLVNLNLKYSANVHKMYVGSAYYEFGKCECRLRGENACRAYWMTALYCLYLPMLPLFSYSHFPGKAQTSIYLSQLSKPHLLMPQTGQKGRRRERENLDYLQVM